MVGVYKIENSKTKKIYIGSSVDLQKRRRAHFNALVRNRHENEYLQNSFNKYGISTFIFEILEKCSKENLLKTEQYYIDKYDFSELYNICPTAGSWKGVKTKTGENSKPHHLSGIKRSDTFKERLKVINGRNKPVGQIDLNTGEIINTFISAAEAARYVGLKSHSPLCACCRGKRQSSMGYGWKYL